jgi:hypothetical protein
VIDRAKPAHNSFDDGTRFLEEATQLSDESILPSGAGTLRARDESAVKQPFQMTSPLVKPLHFIGDTDKTDN